MSRGKRLNQDLFDELFNASENDKEMLNQKEIDRIENLWDELGGPLVDRIEDGIEEMSNATSVSKEKILNYIVNVLHDRLS